MQAHRSQIARDRLLPDHARRHLRTSLRHRVVHRGRARRRPGIAGRRAVRARPLMPRRRPDSSGPTPATRSRSPSAPARSERSPGLLRTLGAAPGHARHDRGPARLRRRRPGAGGHRPGARVDLRRGAVPRAGAARAAGGAAGAARRRRRRRVASAAGSCADLAKAVCFFIEQETGHARRLVRRPAGAARTCRCRRPTRAPSSRRSSA